MESSIYVADVLKVATDRETLTVPAILRVPQSSEDACLKGLPALIENLKTLAPVSGEGKCIEQGGDNLAEFETEMLITTPEVSFRPEGLFVLVVAETSPGTYDLSFNLSKPIDDIVKVLSAGSDDLQTEFDPTKFIFTLNNDATGAVQLLPNHVFVDDAPGLPELGPVTLERRDDVKIVFSDVASTYAEKGNSYRFGTLTAAQ